MDKKSVVVFGAAGFIGTYLIDELVNQGCSVVASDINKLGEQYYREHGIDYVQADITDAKSFDQFPTSPCDSVIHLAALQPANFSSAGNTPEDYVKINVEGTLNVLEFCRRRRIPKIIYASSHRNTAGLWSKNTAIGEKDGRALEYGGEYAMFSISESAAQDLVEYYRANHDLKGIIFRLPPVYGFGPHLEIFKNGKPVKTGFQTFIDQAEAGKPLEMWGDGDVGRDIIYVKDVVAAFVKALDSEDAGGLYNIASGYRLTLKEEVETIARVFWGEATKPVIHKRPDKQHTMDSFLYDNRKARKELDWEPVYDFEAMLLDYRKERERNKFGFLVEKRSNMFKN